MYGGGYDYSGYYGPISQVQQQHVGWQHRYSYIPPQPQIYGHQYTQQGQKRPPIDPSTGHDYRRADDGTTVVDLGRVHHLLARRLQCKMGRQYEEADTIRNELRDLGVEVQDKLKIWTARPLLIPPGKMKNANSNKLKNAYHQPPSHYYPPIPPHQYIEPQTYHPHHPSQQHHLLHQHHSQQQQQSRRPRRGQIDPATGHDYARSENDRHHVDIKAVNVLIARRLQCKMAGQYDEADQVREQLRTDHGVEVQDRDKVWRVVRPSHQQSHLAAAQATAKQLSQQLAKRPREVDENDHEERSHHSHQSVSSDKQRETPLPKRQAQDNRNESTTIPLLPNHDEDETPPSPPAQHQADDELSPLTTQHELQHATSHDDLSQIDDAPPSAAD